MKEKILITGGAGFIGLHLAEKLADTECEIVIIDNFSRGVKDDDLENILSLENVSARTIDFLDQNAVGKIEEDFTFIFHLAAIIGVTHVLKSPYNVLYDNIRMLANVIDLANRQEKLSRLFFSSTSEVYAGTLKNFNLDIPTPENTPLSLTELSHPRTSYMLSKIYGEAMSLQSKLPVTIFRPHNLYGPRMGMSHVIPEQLNKSHHSIDGDQIEVFNPNHTRSFCFIDDAIKMIVGMMNNESCLGQTLNLGTQDNEISIKELAELCYSTVGRDIQIVVNNEDVGSPSRRAPEMSHTYDLTGVESIVTLDDGIQRTYDWYRNNIFEGKSISAK
jgi:nucleoside-diphosphate-sugar epimerase